MRSYGLVMALARRFELDDGQRRVSGPFKCVRMPCACTRKSASEETIDLPVAMEPQLSDRISPRTPCICMRTQD